MREYEHRIAAAHNVIRDADYLLIGGGAGLSAAAGLTYSGDRFTDNFSDFIERYGITDMYSASFYPFDTQEESWAQWARHIHVNRFAPQALPLYNDLLKLVQDKDFFVLTTNVDGQFEKAGFSKARCFATQGDYAFIQCARGCHQKLYPNVDLVHEMLAATVDCRIPSALVPHCPMCGSAMDVQLRHNEFFVEDEAWHESCSRYNDFLRATKGKPIALIEIGVGFNTPGIIRYPFEQMTYQNPFATLIRINRDYPFAIDENKARTISFGEDATNIIQDLLRAREVKTT